jgi:hypothetical protein
MITNRLAFTALASAVALAGTVASSSEAATPALYKNCTNFNKKYPHGVGRLRAKDHTSGTPVTTFKRSTALYTIAMKYNRGLDRDKDGIACESA